MYYMLRKSDFEDYGITKEPRLARGVSFQTGATITGEVPRPLVLEVNTTQAHPPTDFLQMKIPVLSDRLVAKLGDLGIDNVQLFPVQLRNDGTKETWDGYNAVNVLGLISCLAIEQSKATPGLPPLYTFDLSDLVIDERRTDGTLLFRLLEAPRVILVHEQIADALTEAADEFRGLNFVGVGSA